MTRFERYCEHLSDAELVALHRVVSRRANPVYRRWYAGNWEAGMNATRSKRGRAAVEEHTGK